MMKVVIDDFEPDPNRCGVYCGEVHFIDAVTGDEWYKGELEFYYTRNYIQCRQRKVQNPDATDELQ